MNEEQSGIDASRITVRTGAGDSKTVEDYLVPAGATFDERCAWNGLGGRERHQGAIAQTHWRG